MDLEKLKEFSKGRIFIALRVLSRVFVFLFGFILFFDDLLWHNIGGISNATGLSPTMGSIETYNLWGLHIHHGVIGFLFMFIAGFSLLFIYINDIKKN